MEIVNEYQTEAYVGLSPAQSQLIILNVKRVLMAGDITLLGRIAFRFLSSHFSFTHTDSHFTFVSYHQKENFLLFVKTIVNANKTSHENPIVEQTLEALYSICQEAIEDKTYLYSIPRAA